MLGLADAVKVLRTAGDRRDELVERTVAGEVGEGKPIRHRKIGLLLNGVALVGGGLKGETEFPS